jgi:AcrR family transcriptional regulator
MSNKVFAFQSSDAGRGDQQANGAECPFRDSGGRLFGKGEAMHEGRTDRRTRRTRRLIVDALVALMQERRFDRITVQEIIDRADVGRSTFYAHFRDKEEVLTSEFVRVIDVLHQHLGGDGTPDELFLPSLGLFRHVGDQHALLRALVRGHGVEILFEAAQRELRDRAERGLIALLADRAQPSVPLPIVADYLAGTFLSLMRWWLDQRMPHTPEEMEAIYRRLVMPSVREITGLDLHEHTPHPSPRKHSYPDQP